MQVSEAALFPNNAYPRTEPESVDRTNFYIATGVTGKRNFHSTLTPTETS